MGTLGLQYFYVGRRNAGIGQCMMGLFLWGLLIECFFEDSELLNRLLVAAFIVFVLAVISISNFFKIKKGKLTDDLGRAVSRDR